MFSGIFTPPQAASTLVQTRGPITTITCQLPATVVFDNHLAKPLLSSIRSTIRDRLKSSGTPFFEVKTRKPYPTAPFIDGIKIIVPAQPSPPDWIEHHFTNMNFLAVCLGLWPKLLPRFACPDADFALSLSRLAKGHPPEPNDCLILCQLAAHMMYWDNVKAALNLLTLLPEAERIKHLAAAFEHDGILIGHPNLIQLADEHVVLALSHMVAVASYVTSLNPDATEHEIARLTATCQRVNAPTLSLQEVQALDSRYGGSSLTNSPRSGTSSSESVISSSSSSE